MAAAKKQRGGGRGRGRGLGRSVPYAIMGAGGKRRIVIPRGYRGQRGGILPFIPLLAGAAKFLLPLLAGPAIKGIAKLGKSIVGKGVKKAAGAATSAAAGAAANAAMKNLAKKRAAHMPPRPGGAPRPMSGMNQLDRLRQATSVFRGIQRGALMGAPRGAGRPFAQIIGTSRGGGGGKRKKKYKKKKKTATAKKKKKKKGGSKKKKKKGLPPYLYIA